MTGWLTGATFELIDLNNITADAQDKSLANMLASLAHEDLSVSSQQVTTKITALEEQDSVLSQVVKTHQLMHAL